jgi:hypothetical protein
VIYERAANRERVLSRYPAISTLVIVSRYGSHALAYYQSLQLRNGAQRVLNLPSSTIAFPSLTMFLLLETGILGVLPIPQGG